jgi:hypothetical protein
MRHEVDDSSWVVVEQVEEVESQVQVAFNVVGLGESKVLMDTGRRTFQEDESLTVLVTRKETVAALEVQTDNFTELVTNAKVGIPVLEGLTLEVVEVVPNSAIVVGQVAMVDGKTAVGLNVPVLFNRF